jgi:hypothetical protein
METIELIIYLGIAVIVGSLLVFFIGSAGFQDLYEGIRGEKAPEFRKVNQDEFVVEAAEFWQSCGLGTVQKNLTLYLDGQGTYNATVFFERAEKLNLCTTLQSAAQGCGTREQLVMPELTLPRIVNLKCDVAAEQLVIS